MASGKLEVEVIARTEELEKGLARAEAELQNTSQRLEFLGGVTAKVEAHMTDLGVSLTNVATKATEANAAFSPLFETAGASGEQLHMTFKQLDQDLEDFIVKLQDMPEIDLASGTEKAVYGLGQTMPAQGKGIGEKFGKSMLTGLTRGFGVAALAMFTIKTIDDAMKTALDHQKGTQKEGSYGVGVSIAESIAEGISSIPILGSIFEMGGELGDAFHEDAGGGGLTREREQEASRVEAQENQARRARKARQQQRAEEAMKERNERAKVAEEQYELAKLQSQVDAAGMSADKAMDTSSGAGTDHLLSKDQREKALFKEHDLQKQLAKELLEFQIEQRLKSIPEAFEEERKFVEERMRVEASLQNQIREEALIDRLTDLDKEYEHQKQKQKELAQLKADEARKLAEEEYKQAEELAQRTFQVQKEMSDARASAQKKVAGATATFQTAGGAFTVGVNAQVNEAKLLNRISQKSQDFLRKIAINTARAGISLA
jgi:hypothetical protein